MLLPEDDDLPLVSLVIRIFVGVSRSVSSPLVRILSISSDDIEGPLRRLSIIRKGLKMASWIRSQIFLNRRGEPMYFMYFINTVVCFSLPAMCANVTVNVSGMVCLMSPFSVMLLSAALMVRVSLTVFLNTALPVNGEPLKFLCQ